MKRSIFILGILVPCVSMLASTGVAAQRPPPPQPGQVLLVDATEAVEKLLRAGQLDQALAAATTLTREDPNNAKAHYLLGRIEFQREKDAAAGIAFDRAVTLNPNFAEAVFFRGLSAKFGGNHVQAVKDFARAVELDPGEGKYWLEVAHARRQAGQKDAAIDAYEQATQRNPKLEAAWFYLGNLAEEKGDYAKAAHMWENALEIVPSMEQAHFNLGVHHQLRGDAKTALSHFQFFLVQNPHSVEGLKKVIQAAYRMENVELAERHRIRLLDVIAKSADPAIKGLKEFCFDQFDIPGGRIFAFETVDKQGDMYYWYTFRVIDAAGKQVRTINLEASKALTGSNVAFILGRNEGGTHSTFNVAFQTMPAYPELKALVLKANQGELKVSASSTSPARSVPH